MRKIYSMLDWEDYRDDAKDYCENENDEQAVNDMAQSMCFDDWSFFYSEILEKYFDSHECIVTGSIGRYCGTCDGGTVVKNSGEFADLLEDCSYIEIFEDTNCLIVKGYHHDGVNNFEIRELTNKGYDWYRDYSWYADARDTVKYLFNYNFNSRKPQIEWCL